MYATHLLRPRKHLLIRPLVQIRILKRRNHKRNPLIQPPPQLARLPNHPPEVRTQREVDIEHHHVVRAREEARDVAPGVELTVEDVDDEVHVDVRGHERGGGVEGVQGGEEVVDVAGDVFDVDGNGDGAYMRVKGKVEAG